MNYLDRDTLGIYKTHKGPGPHLMGANTLTGDDVVNHKGEALGDIKEIMLDMRNGRVAYAVMSFGGFLGMGDKLFAVPWSALTLDTVNKRFVMSVEKDRLENAPGFDQEHGRIWPTPLGPMNCILSTAPNRIRTCPCYKCTKLMCTGNNGAHKPGWRCQHPVRQNLFEWILPRRYTMNKDQIKGTAKEIVGKSRRGRKIAWK